jgi:endo-1,4-beta-xylanase
MQSMRLASSRIQQIVLCALVAAGCATVASAQTVYNNGTGTNNGFYYSLYTSGGSSNMTFSNQYAGNYALSWSGVNDVVGGKGWNPGGYRTVNYNVGAASGYNNISVYGWTTGPLVNTTSANLDRCTPGMQALREVSPAMGTTTTLICINK